MLSVVGGLLLCFLQVSFPIDGARFFVGHNRYVNAKHDLRMMVFDSETRTCSPKTMTSTHAPKLGKL